MGCQLRAGAHSDYGRLTILKAVANPGGLEVCNQAGDWVAVPIVPGTFVVNLGELMARWTNDNYDAEIRCIPSCADPARPAKYPVTTSGDHLRSQFVRTQAAAY